MEEGKEGAGGEIEVGVGGREGGKRGGERR